MNGWIGLLPALNASLNATSGILILTGFVFIRKKNVTAHRRSMLAACTTSLLFLVSYLFYHYHAGTTRFAGSGWSRPVYFSILTSHTILAALVLPMVIAAVYNGLKSRVARHRRIARWTFPVWLYVSATGVLVYLFLYQWYPSR